MTCPLHTAPQTWCRECFAPFAAVVGNPLLRETVVEPRCGCMGCMGRHSDGVCERRPSPSPSHDASAARIAGLERSVNEYRSQLAASQRDVTNARALITDITDAVGLTGPHQGMADADAPAAVRAAFDALRDEIAALRSVESVQLAAARESRLVDSLRAVLAIVARTGGYMSPEDQQTLRDARAEVA